MPTTLELCEKYFATKDIYKLMNLTKDAIEKDGKYRFFFVLCSVLKNSMCLLAQHLIVKNKIVPYS